MIIFILLAAVFTFAAVIAIAIPLLKKDSPSTSQAPWTAMAVTGILLVGGAALYVSLSNWTWPRAPAGDSPQAMVARLVERLDKNPEDLEGWMMLGRSYMVLEQAPMAVRAYERADRLAQGKNADVLVGLAEALAVENEQALDGRASELLERALVIDPRSGKALFYGGLAALRRGDLPLARERFAGLLALNPPDNVKPVLEEQIAAIDQQLGHAPVAGAPSTPATTPATAPPAAAGAATGEAVVNVNVTLSPKLSANLPASAPLFVFVRDPGQPGPPLAVKRLANRFPQSVQLTAADAMVPGRQLNAGQTVQVVARIARSGTPVAQSGDPFGEISYHVGRDKIVDVVIDQVSP